MDEYLVMGDPYLDPVAEFHQTFQAPILERPGLPSPARQALRVNLLVEELDEFKAAVAAGDMVAVADALCDLQYVLSGAVLEFGMQSTFYPAFRAVHDSNMSKACRSTEEVTETVEYYQRKGVDVTPLPVGNLTVILRNADQKVMKSRRYQPVDLTTFV